MPNLRGVYVGLCQDCGHDMSGRSRDAVLAAGADHMAWHEELERRAEAAEVARQRAFQAFLERREASARRAVDYGEWDD